MEKERIISNGDKVTDEELKTVSTIGYTDSKGSHTHNVSINPQNVDGHSHGLIHNHRFNNSNNNNDVYQGTLCNNPVDADGKYTMPIFFTITILCLISAYITLIRT